MDIMGLPATEAASLAGNFIIGGYLAYKGWREKQFRKKGLKANPLRCNDHEVALGRIDERLKHLEDDIKEIKDKIYT